jgi:hypothetical protein
MSDRYEWDLGANPTLKVRAWWWLACALFPFCRISIWRPYGWAHVRWLRAHTAMVEDRISETGHD